MASLLYQKGVCKSFSSGKVSRFGYQSGQALLIVLLTMAVAIVVVLSVVSKSVTDIAITSTEEDSLRAFSAAEAGVEQALSNLVPGNIETTVGTSTFSASVTQNTVGDSFNYPEQLLSGETATIWFVGRNQNELFSCETGITCTKTNSLDLYWGGQGNTDTPAVEITFYYDPSRRAFLRSGNGTINYASVTAKTFAFDINAAVRSNSFTSNGVGGGGYTLGGVEYEYKVTIDSLTSSLGSCVNNTQTCLIMAKVRMLYNTTPQSFGVSVGGDLPSQGFLISSTGEAGETRRKVEVLRGYPEPPSVFDSTVFSLKGLEK